MWKDWGGKYGEQLKEELIQENWSGTRDHTESLEIRLNRRHKVSACTTGTGEFKTHKQAAKQFPAGSSMGTTGFGDRAEGRLGRTSRGRRGAELGAGKGRQEQSRAHRRQLLPAPPATRWDCNGRFCPTGQAASSSALPRSVTNAQAEILFICLNSRRPKTKKHTENADELILWLLI